MRKVLCCSTQEDFQKDLPKGLLEDFKQRWGVEEVICQTVAVDDHCTNVDWNEMKEQGVEIVVFCDDPHQNDLHIFFQEVASANLLSYWYSRFRGTGALIEILTMS